MDEEEKHILFNAFFLLSFLIYLLTLFLSDGHSEKDERSIYLLFFSVGPLVTIIVYRTVYKKNHNILIENALLLWLPASWLDDGFIFGQTLPLSSLFILSVSF